MQETGPRGQKHAPPKVLLPVHPRILFSHYIAAAFLPFTHFQMLYIGWRGYVVSLFSVVWVANQYMSIYNRLRLDIKHENLEIKVKEGDVGHRKAA